jgi:hypothetical protein
LESLKMSASPSSADPPADCDRAVTLLYGMVTRVALADWLIPMRAAGVRLADPGWSQCGFVGSPRPRLGGSFLGGLKVPPRAVKLPPVTATHCALADGDLGGVTEAA